MWPSAMVVGRLYGQASDLECAVVVLSDLLCWHIGVKLIQHMQRLLLEDNSLKRVVIQL